MSTHTIAFIGGGNMARSLIGGLVADGWPANQIRVADPNQEQVRQLGEHFGVVTSTDNEAALEGAEVLVLAVKPQVARQVVESLRGQLGSDQLLLLSIAAGVREPALRRWAAAELPIVRTMPNTPALVRSGATALFANSYVTAAQRDLAETVLRAVGLTVWVDQEAHLDAVTAISGSGPAYFFLLMEALETAGTEMGLKPELARLLSLQTGFGAAKLALESKDSPADLRRRVTSPGGTTERAVEVLQGGDLLALVRQAAAAAKNRSEELAVALEDQQ